MTAGPISRAKHGIRVSIHVVPRAQRTEIVGFHGGSIKLKVQAPPVDGAANDEIVRFFAEALGLPRRDVAIVAGATSRRKVVEFRGVRQDQVIALLPA